MSESEKLLLEVLKERSFKFGRRCSRSAILGWRWTSAGWGDWLLAEGGWLSARAGRGGGGGPAEVRARSGD